MAFFRLSFIVLLCGASVACSKSNTTLTAPAPTTSNTGGNSGGTTATPAPTTPTPKISLTWKPADAGQDGFDVEGSSDGTTFTLLQKVADPAATGATIADPSPSQKYYIRVRAYNSAGLSAFTAVLQLEP